MLDAFYDFFLRDQRKRNTVLMSAFVLAAATVLSVTGPKPVAVASIVLLSAVLAFVLNVAYERYLRNASFSNASQLRSPRPTAVEPRGPTPGATLDMFSYLDAESDFEGHLRFGELFRIDAKFTGTIVGGTLIVGQTGRVSGNIRVKTLLISGNVRGLITAVRVEAHRHANVSGELYGNEELVIEDGAIWNVRVLQRAAEDTNNGNVIV
jgi:cytoskeletal protein CcmA (bactofilin family)